MENQRREERERDRVSSLKKDCRNRCAACVKAVLMAVLSWVSSRGFARLDAMCACVYGWMHGCVFGWMHGCIYYCSYACFYVCMKAL
jgi:hypothetical protein